MIRNRPELFELFAHKRKVCSIRITPDDDVRSIITTIRHIDYHLNFHVADRVHPDLDKYLYVGRHIQDLTHVIHAVQNNEHTRAGHLFGYPVCCVDSFIYHQGSVFDNSELWTPAFELAHEDAHHPSKRFNLYSKYMNPTLQLLSHIPCSLHCQKSVDIAKWRYDFMYRRKVPESSYFVNNTEYLFTIPHDSN